MDSSLTSLQAPDRDADAHLQHSLAPTSPRERLPILDVLRGFAMFGVLLSNLNTGYGVSAPVTPLDSALSWVQQNLVEGRFYALLGFLFGLGFSLQLIRAEQRGHSAVGLYLRRLTVLLGLGLIHGLLIWRGDILTFYALVGLFLPPYTRLSGRRLLIAAILTFFGVSMVQTGLQLALGLRMVAPPPSPATDLIYVHGTAASIFAQRARDFVGWYSWWPLDAFAPFLTLFVLGLWVGRSGIVPRLAERPDVLRKAFGIAAICCALGLILQNNLNAWWPKPESVPASWGARAALIPRFLVGLVAGTLAVWSMTAMYASALALFQRRFNGRGILRPLAAIGRMTLTTYLCQSIVCTLLFYSYGAGWFGRVSYTGMFALALVLFSLQAIASLWWLSRYRFGPVEWAWRSLAYGVRQPMRLISAPGTR